LCRHSRRIPKVGGVKLLAAYREAMKHQGERVDLVSIRNEVEVQRPAGTTRAYSLAVVQQECDKATVAMVRHCTQAAAHAGIRC
jgi:hypothetical protein